MVAVVQVRIMRVAVLERLVHVLMRVRLGAIPRLIMAVPMMLIVHVSMHMRQRRVPVRMLVPLGEMQPDTCRHQ